MPTEESQSPSSRSHAKAICVAHRCPKCGTDHHVSVEEVLTGEKTVTWCHCRACGHSWHPVELAAS